MRKLLLLIFATASLYLGAQQPSCASAHPFCASGSSGVTFPASTGAASAQAGPDYGCLNTVPNPAWYYLQVGTAGSLDVLIQGQTGVGTNTTAGQDVDFICWGPFNSLSSSICNSLTAANTVDCSYSASYTETLNIANGVVGQYYMVLITNFSNSTQNIIFNQLSGTGNTDCTILQANNPSICAGSTATITAANGSSLTSPGYSINPGGITNNTGVFAVSPTITTTYTLYVTGLNSSNVVLTQTAVSTVSVNPQPIVAPTTTQSTCTNTLSAFNLHLSFNPASPAPTYTVAWPVNNIPNNITSVTQTSASGFIGAGVYPYTVTANGGCTATGAITINALPAPANYTLTPLGTGGIFSVTCASPTLIVDATNTSLSYTWTNGTSAPIQDYEAVFTTGNLGTWTITGVNPQSGCFATHIFTVAQNFVAPVTNISPILQPLTCVSTASTVTVTVTSPTLNITQYFLSASGGSVSSTSQVTIYEPGGPGTYTNCVINNLNGCSTCKTFSVVSNDNFPTLNVASPAPSNFTVGCNTHSIATVNLSGATTPTAGGNISFALYTPITPTSGTFGGTTTFTLTTPGTYTAAVKDVVSGCVTKVPFTIIQDIAGPNINVDVPDPILSCYTRSTVLTGSTPDPAVDFAWSYHSTTGTGTLSISNSSIAVNTNTNPTNVSSGTVDNFTLTLHSNVNGCYSNTVILVRENLYAPIARIYTTQPITCNTPSVALNQNNVTTIPSGFPNVAPVIAASWQGPPPQDPSGPNSSYAAYVPNGTYSMTALDLNNGCTSSTTINVVDGRAFPNVNQAGTPTVEIDCGALTQTIAIVTTGTATPYLYNWTTPNQNVPTSPVSGIDTPISKLTLSLPFTAGDYRVRVTNTISGCSSSGDVIVNLGNLTASFAADHTTGFAPLTVNFSNNSNSTAGNTASIVSVWSYGNGLQQTTASASISPVTVYTQPGTYTVILYASKGSCQDTSMQTIHVDIPSKLEIPNVFTPNGDGINDVFFLHVSNQDEITASIFDRWGHKVYEITSTTGNIAWDGKTDVGRDATAGVYFYIIKATGKDGQSYNTKGTITLYK